MRLTLGLAFMAGCGFGHLPDQDSGRLNAELWDPEGAVATPDGLLVPLPHTGNLARIGWDGTAERVDLGQGRLVRLLGNPDGTAVAAEVERTACQPDDDSGPVARFADQCDGTLLTLNEIALVDGLALAEPYPFDDRYSRLAWSPDGRYAVAWLDLADAASIPGVVNLTSVAILDSETADITVVPVGFAASQVLFTDDGRFVVLSQNQVAVADLLTGEREVAFSLTLDPDQIVNPVGIGLTPDGEYVVTGVQGSSDLYVLDLGTHSVNIVSLSSIPSAIDVDGTVDRTVVVYNGATQVDVIDHDRFDTETVDLDEACDTIVPGPGFVMLARVGGQDVYRLDPVTTELVEYRLHGPLDSLHLAPAGDFAVVLTRSAGVGDRPAMEVLDLRDDRGHAYPYLLEGRGIDVAFDTSGGALDMLLLQDGVDSLYRLDLYSSDEEIVDLLRPPVRIGGIPDGGFWVEGDLSTGIVSLLRDDAIVDVTGFAADGLADPTELVEVQP